MEIQIPNVVGVENMSFVYIVVNLINWVINFFAVVSVIMVVTFGYLLMFTGGDEEKTKKASESLLLAILGMVLVFITPLVIQFIIDKFLAAEI